MNIKTAEFVSPKHPDKVCDIIADTLLDAYLEQDPSSRAAIEAMGGHGLVTVTGEVTSNAKIDPEKIIKGVVNEDYLLNVKITQQSKFIAQGVDAGGAGDQGIMTGYATRDTDNYMPKEYELARGLCEFLFAKFPYDGKTQITLADGRVQTAVASFQNTHNDELRAAIRSFIEADEYLVNPAGEWFSGGFDADSGLSGRKIVVDNYGPEVSVGGGSFSGKDWTKVDRSGAYMARRIAVDLLEKNPGAKTVRTKLAYAIGKKEPVMAAAEIDGVQQAIEGYDLSPKGIYNFLELGKVKFAQAAQWGHFGRGFTWK